MAVSQEHFAYPPSLLTAIATRMTSVRMSRYLIEASKDPEWAIKLYLWNARLAKSYLYPLHVAEVVTRNSVDAALRASYGDDWLTCGTVQFTPQSTKSRDTALDRLARDRNQDGRPPPQRDDKVAALSFDFWSNLFRTDYDYLWSKPGLLKAVFPKLPGTHGRNDVQQLVKEINKLRNRIAHHEPVYQYSNYEQRFERIITLIEWQCPEVADWVRRHSTVIAEGRARPSRLANLPGPLLSSVTLKPPPIFATNCMIQDAVRTLAADRIGMGLIEIDNATGCPHRLITLRDLLNHGVIEAEGGYLNLGERTLEELLSDLPFRKVISLDRSMTTGDARATFFSSKD